MNNKIKNALILLIVFVAISATILVAKSQQESRSIFVFAKGENMSEEKISQEMAEYNQLVEELNKKYLYKFCDIFQEAKDELIEKTDDILGEEYKKTIQELKSLRENVAKERIEHNNSQEINELKDKLALSKEKLLTSKTEEEKVASREEMNAILAEITKKNLENFANLSKSKTEIDALSKKAIEICEGKKKELVELESKIISSAKTKIAEIAVSFKGEIDAISKVFGVSEYSTAMPFMRKVDMNMRLVDFDKDIFLMMLGENKPSCSSSCGGNCKTCPSQKQQTFFNSTDEHGSNN